MEHDLDLSIVKATQESLGKYVKKPPLTEKLLKKPPFRFMHDIITAVLKTTGFFDGLFDETELNSDNVKDRDSKVAFLNKVITVLSLATGEKISAKPAKIVAGQEPEKTNELLQCLALALDKKITSDAAVQKFKDGVNVSHSNSKEKKAKDPVKISKTINEEKREKLTSRSSEKITGNKKETLEKKLKTNDKNKSKDTRQGTIIKKESPPKNISQNDRITNKTGKEKNLKKNEKNVRNDSLVSETTVRIPQVLATENKTDYLKPQEIANAETSQVCYHEHSNGDHSEIDQNNSVDKQDKSLKKNDNLNPDEITYIKQTDENSFYQSDDIKTNESRITSSIDQNKTVFENSAKHREIKPTNFEPKDLTSQNIQEESSTKAITEEKENIYNRPVSVRPLSSRPGAPRPREKHEHILAATENLLVGKVNIIVENGNEEEEEETSIIVVESNPEEEQQVALQTNSNQHGHLVQQILDSQKEFSKTTSKKTEIEWQMGVNKAKEAFIQEIEQIKVNIQALSRVANPLGKLIDHIQEDVEVMRQELQQWTNAFEEASRELSKQKIANADSLLPLMTKIKQLDIDINEKKEKIIDIKVIIQKNSIRIDKLLSNTNVQ